MDFSGLEQIVGEKIVCHQPLGGGCIAKIQKIVVASGARYVIKQVAGEVCVKEADGLKALKACGCIRVPQVIHAEPGLLILEFIEEGLRPKDFFDSFGQKLAELHRCQGSWFGFYEDNYIGSTPQVNTPVSNDWVTFYFEKRLLYQFRLAEKNGYVDDRFRSLFVNLESRLTDILAGSEELPCLIHGDLWSGNFMVDQQGNPVLIDPAAYYGHREAELAMTHLFGGFAPQFYEAYQQAYPLKPGSDFREAAYTLYHVLNHLNLFGSGYRAQAISLMQQYR